MAVTYRTVSTLTAQGSDTRLSIDFSVTGYDMSPGMRLMTALTRPIAITATRKALREELADIEEAAFPGRVTRARLRPSDG